MMNKSFRSNSFFFVVKTERGILALIWRSGEGFRERLTDMKVPPMIKTSHKPIFPIYR